MDKGWEVMNALRETWCESPCNYRYGCGCADAIQAAIQAEQDRCLNAIQDAQHEILEPTK